MKSRSYRRGWGSQAGRENRTDRRGAKLVAQYFGGYLRHPRCPATIKAKRRRQRIDARITFVRSIPISGGMFATCQSTRQHRNREDNEACQPRRYERDVSETESSRYAFTYPTPGLPLSHFPHPSGTPEQTRHEPFQGVLRGRIPQDCSGGPHRGRSSVKLTVIAPKFLLEDSRRSVSGARDRAVHMSCMYPRSRRPKC